MPLSEFYIVSEALPKPGGQACPVDTQGTPHNWDTTELNDKRVIIANGKGIQIFDRNGINNSSLSGWVCRFSARVLPPKGLKIVEQQPGQHCISPARNMTEDKLLELLKEMTLSAITLLKRQGKKV